MLVRLLRLVVVGCCALLLLVGARDLWVLAGPRPGARQLAEQARFLEADLARGGAARSQQLFPEGAAFEIVLSGLVTAADTTRGEAERLELVRQRLAEFDSPMVTSVFGDPQRTEHGVFHAGWRMLLQVEAVRLGDASQRDDLVRRTSGLARVIADEPGGFPEAYPGGRWPCDTVVALGAIARADALVGVPGARGEIGRWLTTTEALRGEHGGLLPHRVDDRGRTIEGPRGTSASLIALFWPDLDPAGAPDQWAAFHRAFVTRELGLVGAREHPHGITGGGDVDSGPLVLGVSFSSSTVTLAAAKRNGAHQLAAGLEREATLLGMPITWSGRRAHVGGALPVGDAFVAWAHSVPPANPSAAADGPRARLWPGAVGLPWALAGLGLLLVRGTRVRRART